MTQLLGLTLLTLVITAILIIPFIDFLYKIKLRRQDQATVDPFNKPTPLFDKFNKWKVGTPFGGGLLIICVSTVIFLWSFGMLNVKINPLEIFVILFTFISFGLLGLYDDGKKLANGAKVPFFGLRLRYKFLLQLALAFVPATILYTKLGYSFVFIRGIGLTDIGFLYIPFAAFVIVAFVNAFNITDGLDGLAPGLMLIALVSFLAISYTNVDQSLGIFVAVLMGSIAAFLYFNIYKARIWLGDVGSMSLGASLAIIGLLTGKTLAIVVIGGVFVLEVGSSLLQLASKKFLKRKILPAAPLHLYFLKRGWDEPKIVMRAWLLGAFFAILGLYLAFIK
ncbi:MAG TPA: phospho-N-acetylmuramoyl-pentapeptide-transferase [Patescibacteria group bacterium]|jgi:phospho-N-acetylmuramoyl-pentapeptide-transferase|nr:phospho-N-acetylmuramoyl-pentapeptide-transferase [Patescibacteria group bacterium]